MKRRLLLWAVAVVFPLPLVLTYHFQAADPWRLKFYILLGLIAYAWWLLSIVLSVRPPWLDRLVGLPAIYGLHGMIGVLALVLAYIHSENGYAPVRWARYLGDWGFYGAVTTLCFAVFFLSGWLADRSMLVLRIKRFLEIVFRHQLSVWIHRLNLVIVVMIWLHAHLLERVNQYFVFMTLFDLYTVAALTLYAWKKWIAPDNYLAGTVQSNDARGETTRRISIALDQEEANVQPGDFFFLSFEGSSAVSREWHPFSVTDDNRKVLTFTIRQHGNFTRRLGNVKNGTRVRLEGPFGRFDTIVRNQEAEAPLVLLGMGAGVSPLLSLTAAHHTERRIHLLWSVRRKDDIYYRDQLDEYRAASGGRLQVSTRIGRFKKEHLAKVLPEEVLKTGVFFIVGPNNAVLSSQRLLRRMGVAARRIHHERLTM
jgi:predicted ferric reductase